MTGSSRRLICSVNIHLSSSGDLAAPQASRAKARAHLVKVSDTNGFVTVPATLVLSTSALRLGTGVGVPAGKEVVHHVVEAAAAVHLAAIGVDQARGLGCG